MATKSLKIVLFEKIDQHFDLEELRSLCFYLDVDYDSLEGEGKQAKARALIGYLQRRNRLGNLVEHLRTQHQYIDLSSLPATTPLPSRVERIISFVNRNHELKALTDPLIPPYVLINAPAGYGKSSLLHELHARYQQDPEWISALADFRNPSLIAYPALMVHELGGQIPGYAPPPTPGAPLEEYILRLEQSLLEAQKNAILLFDSVERLDNDRLRWLLNDFVVRVQRDLKGVGYGGPGRRFRAIFSGRASAEAWRTIPYQEVPLTPFDLTVVQSTLLSLVDCMGLALAEGTIEWVSRGIMQLTGGHPGCIAAVLTELAQRRFLGLEQFFDPAGQKEILRRIVQPAIEELRRDIPPELYPVFETVSVFRRFNHDTLDSLLKLSTDGIALPPKLAGKADPPWALLQEITRTHMVQLRDGYYSDDINRRLLTIALRQSDAARFRRLCAHAEAVYRDWLHRPNINNPHLLAIEASFQQLQAHAFGAPPDAQKLEQQVIETLNDYLDHSDHPFGRAYALQSLQQELERDWEWQFMADSVLWPGAGRGMLEQV